MHEGESRWVDHLACDTTRCYILAYLSVYLHPELGTCYALDLHELARQAGTRLKMKPVWWRASSARHDL